jgi:hypothetical protein
MRAIIITALGLAAAAPAVAGSFGISYLGLRGSYVQAEDQASGSLNIDDSRTFSDGWGASGFMGFVIDDALRGDLDVTIAVVEALPLTSGSKRHCTLNAVPA